MLQIVLLGDKSTCVNKLSKVAVKRPGVELASCDLSSCKPMP